MAQHPAEKFISTTVGPLAVVRACKLCGFFVTRRRGGGGRGAGFREGNKQRGVMIGHIKSCHAEEFSKAKGA